MVKNRSNLVVGLALILLGGLFLLETVGVVPAFSAVVWALVFAGASVFFAATFVVSGKHHWGWLIPASVTGGLAAVIALSTTAIDGVWLGALFMASVSAPFWLIYLLNRQEHWWALIPAYATAVVTAIILVSEQWAGELIGTLVMWSIALPFFFVYVRNREHWWALIPGGVMAGIGLIVLLATQGSEDVIGSLVLLMIAAPFLAVFFLAKGQWWAIIPAGVLTTIALIIPLANAAGENDFAGQLIGAVLFLGWSVPFVWLWWRRDAYETGWAKYPAVASATAAVVILVFGTVIENSWPIILIAVGLWLLYDNVRQPKLKS